MRKTMFHELREIIIALKDMKKTVRSDGEKIAFGEDKEQYYILKLPKNNVNKTLTVYIHGGAFRFSSAEEHNFVGDFYTDKGYANVNMCYRKVPKHKYPTAIEDVFVGLKHALEKLESLNYEFKDIVVTGSSAGAYLGAMLAFNTKLQEKHGLNKYNIKGFCSLSGLVNIDYNSKNLAYRTFVKNYFEGIEDNTIDYVENRSDLEMLVIHSKSDPLVDYEKTKAFYSAYKGPKRLREIEDKLHTKVCVAPFIYDDMERKIYLEWLERFE